MGEDLETVENCVSEAWAEDQQNKDRIYLPSSTNDTETTVKMVDAELPTVTSFKYIGSIFTSEGGSQADVTGRHEEIPTD